MRLIVETKTGNTIESTGYTIEKIFEGTTKRYRLILNGERERIIGEFQRFGIIFEMFAETPDIQSIKFIG